MEPQALDFYHKLKEGSMDLYFIIFERRLVSTILASMKQEQGE
jgi:hypothetical protein